MADFIFPEINNDITFPRNEEGIVAAKDAKGYNSLGVLVNVKDKEITPDSDEYQKDVNGITSPNLHRRIEYDDVTGKVPQRPADEPEELHEVTFTVTPDDWKQVRYETSSGSVFQYRYDYYMPGLSYLDYISGAVSEDSEIHTAWMVETLNNYITVRTALKPDNTISFQFYIEYFEEITKYRRDVFIGKYGVNSYRLERIHYHEDDSDDSEIP